MKRTDLAEFIALTSKCNDTKTGSHPSEERRAPVLENISDQENGESKGTLLHSTTSSADDKAIALGNASLFTAQNTFASKMSAISKTVMILALIAVAMASFAMGHLAMNPIEVMETTGGYIAKVIAYIQACLTNPSLWSDPDFTIPMTQSERVLFLIRMPRIIVVILVGAALSVAGASFQGMFRNPLTSPDLLGASGGASLGACLALLTNQSSETVQLFAFVGALIAVGLTVWLNKQAGSYDPLLGLVLAGILVGTLFQAAMSAIKLLADANDKLPEITFWLMGSFHDIRSADLIIIPIMALGFILLLSQSWNLNVLALGDEEARSMGVKTGRTRLIVILAATLVTGASVAVAGIIGWVGLVVPHLARAIVGPNYRALLPASILMGALFLLVVDDVARLVLPIEIPIGILTAILGVPFFMVIFKRNMRGW